MKDKYYYFVSYYIVAKNGDGMGRYEVTLDHEIESFDDIKKIENEIKKLEKAEVVITNFIKLRKG